MAKDALLQVRISPDLKKAAEEVFSGIGISSSEAVRMFLAKTVSEQQLPFDPRSERPSGNLKAFGALNIFASPTKRGLERDVWVSSLDEYGRR